MSQHERDSSSRRTVSLATSVLMTVLLVTMLGSVVSMVLPWMALPGLATIRGTEDAWCWAVVGTCVVVGGSALVATLRWPSLRLAGLTWCAVCGLVVGIDASAWLLHVGGSGSYLAAVSGYAWAASSTLLAWELRNVGGQRQGPVVVAGGQR